MATVTELELPAEEFALWETFTAAPNIEFEAERIVAHEPDQVMPILWIGGGNREELSAALEEDPSVEDEDLLVDLNDKWLYRMTWLEGIEAVIQSLVHEEGTITTAHGRNDRWILRIIFPDRAALSRTYQYCQEEDLTIHIRNVRRMEDEPAAQFGLSDIQYRTLITAYNEGYFQIPRETTIEELSNKLDISAQSVSERLRRGHNHLIDGALPVEVEKADTNL